MGLCSLPWVWQAPASTGFNRFLSPCWSLCRQGTVQPLSQTMCAHPANSQASVTRGSWKRAEVLTPSLHTWACQSQYFALWAFPPLLSLSDTSLRELGPDPQQLSAPHTNRIKYSCSWRWLQGREESRLPFKIDLLVLRPLVRGLLQLLEGGPSHNTHFLITRQVCYATENSCLTLSKHLGIYWIRPEIRPQTWPPSGTRFGLYYQVSGAFVK